jgi:hypothetical protein
MQQPKALKVIGFEAGLFGDAGEDCSRKGRKGGLKRGLKGWGYEVKYTSGTGD